MYESGFKEHKAHKSSVICLGGCCKIVAALNQTDKTVQDKSCDPETSLFYLNDLLVQNVCMVLFTLSCVE